MHMETKKQYKGICLTLAICFTAIWLVGFNGGNLTPQEQKCFNHVFKVRYFAEKDAWEMRPDEFPKPNVEMVKGWSRKVCKK